MLGTLCHQEALWEGEADSWYNSIAGSERGGRFLIQLHSWLPGMAWHSMGCQPIWVARPIVCFPPLFYPILLLAQFFKATQFPHQGCLHRLGGLVWFGFFFAPRWMELCWVAKDEASPCKVGNHSRKHLHHQLQRQG